jgi:hypothetical protein
MRRQRAAVGGDDLETVDDTVFATHRLLAAATALAREVDINRRVLREALAGGEAHVRTLRGLPVATPGAIGGPVATLVDRRA